MPGIQLLMPEAKQTKTQLRSDLRQRRQSLGQEQQLQAARDMAQQVASLPLWHDAQRIALYLAADGEIDTGPLAEAARDLGKQLFLPLIHAGSEQCAPEALEIIFLPLVAWDKSGHRLGMGSGFYDRTLDGIKGPLRVGLAHEVQQVASVPHDPWDIALHFVATNAALYRCTGS
jgi:5-formyltetrahydrofolate cyclo-ligase